MTGQNARLLGRAWQAGRGLFLLANKWDLVPPARRDRAAFRAALVAAHPAFAELPLLCVSAVTGEGVGDLFPPLGPLGRPHQGGPPPPPPEPPPPAPGPRTPTPPPPGQ